MTKIKMHLNIGDQEITVQVPSDRRDFIRDVEKNVNGLYSKWRKDFPGKTNAEILAMVTYQYASFYSTYKERYEAALSKADECLGMLEIRDNGNEG